MARNTLAGKSTGKSKSARYYAKNKEANKTKLAYMKEYNKDPKKVKYRAELNKANRKNHKSGKTRVGDKKDVSHKKDGSLSLEKMERNRARNGANNKSTKR